jgi:transposase
MICLYVLPCVLAELVYWRKLVAWAGLTLALRGSDRIIQHGHISRQGPVRVRRVLCEAAQTARRRPDFAPGSEALARRRGNKIATTTIARMLLTRTFHLLTDASSGSA